MSKKECCSEKSSGSSVTVLVDVSKMVKYLCFAGIIIVGIIFGSKCYQKMLTEGFFDR